MLTAAEAADVLHRYTRLRQRVWQIISFTGHQAASVLQVLHQAGIRLCDDRRPGCWPDREIVRRHRRNQPSTTIAAPLGMNPETVRLRLDALGIPRRTVTHRGPLNHRGVVFGQLLMVSDGAAATADPRGRALHAPSAR